MQADKPELPLELKIQLLSVAQQLIMMYFSQ